ncbi:MAG: hypothetical protein WCE62_02060 [Polyangiales bacterium]
MRELSSATTLCRVLIGLDRAGASGTLHLSGEGSRAAIALHGGRVVGATVGRGTAVLPRELLDSVLQVCRWDGLVLRLVQSSGAETWCQCRNPIPARTLALQGMRAVVMDLDAVSVGAELGDAIYHLTDTGETLLAGAELRPEETAALFWLRRGVLAPELLALPGCGPVAQRFVWMLKLLGVAAPKPGGSYPLLLRKRREVRRAASAHALLDLPDGAGRRDARLALRKLVRDLHPDRFGERAPLALRRASGEIMSALVHAEACIASGRVR